MGKILFVTAFVCCSPEEIQQPQGWNGKWRKFGFDIPQDDHSSRIKTLLKRKTLKKLPDLLKLEIFRVVSLLSILVNIFQSFQ